MTTTASPVTVHDLEVFADRPDVQRAAAIYREHGALVVRGLMKPYLAELTPQIEAAAQQAVALLPEAKRIPEGWATPDGTLFLPAPPGFKRDKQIMVLGINYTNSGAFFRSALDPKAVAIAEAVLGPNLELFLGGQCLYKEPVGGHPKLLHQDAAYFEHKYDGPCGVLSYAVDTDLKNGALHVVPGSHKWGVLRHVDTFSHLGLDPREWTFDKALPIVGQAGDAIFFHVNTIHGSMENHSDKARPVFIHRYRRADDYIVISATTTENRALAEKRVAEAKKENQKGYMVRGFRPYDAERGKHS
jgi:phytanoyl-CoA hydroxylase